MDAIHSLHVRGLDNEWFSVPLVLSGSAHFRPNNVPQYSSDLPPQPHPGIKTKGLLPSASSSEQSSLCSGWAATFCPRSPRTRTRCDRWGGTSISRRRLTPLATRCPRNRYEAGLGTRLRVPSAHSTRYSLAFTLMLRPAYCSSALRAIWFRSFTAMGRLGCNEPRGGSGCKLAPQSLAGHAVKI